MGTQTRRQGAYTLTAGGSGVIFPAKGDTSAGVPLADFCNPPLSWVQWNLDPININDYRCP